MKCKHCGKDVNESMNFCSYCGSKIEHSEITNEEFELIKNQLTQTKLRCKTCDSDNIQFVSEYVELKDRTPPKSIIFLYFISILGLIFGLVFLFASLSSTANNQPPLITAFGRHFFLILSAISLLILLVASILCALLPYEHKTYVRAICKECGNSWRINESKSEIKQ